MQCTLLPWGLTSSIPFSSPTIITTVLWLCDLLWSFLSSLNWLWVCASNYTDKSVFLHLCFAASALPLSPFLSICFIQLNELQVRDLGGESHWNYWFSLKFSHFYFLISIIFVCRKSYKFNSCIFTQNKHAWDSVLFGLVVISHHVPQLHPLCVCCVFIKRRFKPSFLTVKESFSKSEVTSFSLFYFPFLLSFHFLFCSPGTLSALLLHPSFPRSWLAEFWGPRWSGTPSPTAKPRPPPNTAEEERSPYSAGGVLSFIQSTTRRAYQQVLEVLDENPRRWPPKQLKIDTWNVESPDYVRVRC